MKRFSTFAGILGCGALAIFPASMSAQPGSHAEHHPPQTAGTMIRTPASIAAEHAELHDMLERATRESGKLGAAARALEAALTPHFRREEEIATPPLGLLPALASGKVSADMDKVLPLTQALERELPQMLREHEAIRAAAARFRAAAQADRRVDYVRFSDQLAAHAREEEEILYPAAVLVGRYVASRSPPPK